MDMTIAETLRCAANIIRLHGHAKKTPTDNSGRVCASFAIHLAANTIADMPIVVGRNAQHYLNKWLQDNWSEITDKPWHETYSEMSSATIMWSDYIAEDAEEIATIMEKAAAQHEELAGI